MSFSLRRTIKALLKETTSGEDITCIHGIRALATIALYVAHQLITISRIPFSNRTSLTEVRSSRGKSPRLCIIMYRHQINVKWCFKRQIANNPASSILRVSLVYTDAFLLLSGLLTAYNMARELKIRGEIRWFCRFITRFIRHVAICLHELKRYYFLLILKNLSQLFYIIDFRRLSPALLAVVFWYAFVMEHMGSGPQWNSVITPNAELCKHNAWTNLLYVQNFFPFEEMVSCTRGDRWWTQIRWWNVSFAVRHAHASVGPGYAVVAPGAHLGLLPAVQASRRYPPDNLRCSVVRHSTLHSDNEQLSFSHYLSRDIVSIHFWISWHRIFW